MGDRSFEAFPVDLVGLRLAYSRIHTIITAGIPGSCPLQDVGESLLTVSWLFQRPVNSVGQANGLRRWRVWLTYGFFMCRKLPCRLRKQFLLSNRKCVSTGGTSQTDLSAVTARPADPEQAGLTATAVYRFPSCPAAALPLIFQTQKSIRLFACKTTMQTERLTVLSSPAIPYRFAATSL